MDPRLELIDHPRQDPPPAADPALTAAVMARIRPRPVAAPARSGRGAWWVIAGVAVTVSIFLPLDLGDVDLALDGGLAADLGVMVALVAIGAALVGRRRRQA